MSKRTSRKLFQTNLDFLNSCFLVADSFFFFFNVYTECSWQISWIHDYWVGNVSFLTYFLHILSCSISYSSNNSLAQVDKNSYSKKGVIVGAV